MISLTPVQYEALLAWAKVGAEADGAGPVFLAFRQKVDSFNAVRRYTLVIKYDTLPQKPYLGMNAVPRGLTKVIELHRPPAREDVLAALRDERFDEPLVYVTADPNGEVGWYQLNDYPWS